MNVKNDKPLRYEAARFDSYREWCPTLPLEDPSRCVGVMKTFPDSPLRKSQGDERVNQHCKRQGKLEGNGNRAYPDAEAGEDDDGNAKPYQPCRGFTR